jgi:exopolyphosphatase/guanosine-5'-triphosphate,3'-diphosphate pyrophosphatase
VVHLPLARLRALTETLASLSFAQRVEELGLREDRADVILPAAYIYERISEFVGADALLVPNVGVKEGVLLDLAEDTATHRAHEDEQDRHALAAAIALGRRYAFDEEHGVQVSRLAVSLFEQLRELHGLDDTDRRILLTAAVLHDIGAFVSYKKHHKHSLYLILNSEISGFTPREMLMIANIARYHRKGPPSSDHEHYEMLSPREQERVSRLSALLRIADALDREHRQRVDDVVARVEDGKLHLAAEGTGDLLLERWALEKKADLFERLFDLEVRMVLAGEEG